MKPPRRPQPPLKLYVVIERGEDYLVIRNVYTTRREADGLAECMASEKGIGKMSVWEYGREDKCVS